MEYIDFHTHTFPDKIAEKAVGKLSVISGITPATNGTLEQTKDLMSKVGISRFVIFNIATNPGQENTNNNTAAKVCEDNKGKIISLGSVHPRSQDAFDHLENVKKLGLQGIKLHPDYQEFHVDDEFMYPFYKACEELELFVAFHAGYDFYSPDHIHARPEALSKIAKDFPNLKMHFAHMGSLRRWNEVSECIAGLENVYMDTFKGKMQLVKFEEPITGGFEVKMEGSNFTLRFNTKNAKAVLIPLEIYPSWYLNPGEIVIE